MVGWGLRGGGRGWKEGFGIGWEVLASIRTVEAFGKDYNFCTGLGSFEDFGTRTRKIYSFVGTFDCF